MCTMTIICYNKNMKRLITLLYIKIGGEKMYDENEWGENVRMTRRRQQKQAARKRMIMIGAAVAVFLIIAGGVAGLYFHGKNSSDAKARP